MSVVGRSGLEPSFVITELPAGWIFPAMLVELSAAVVERYVDAVGPGSAVRDPGQEALVPPTALVALCLTACLEIVRLPSDALHISQEMEMFGPVEVASKLSLHALIEAKGERAGVTIVRVALAAADAGGYQRMRGRASILIPSTIGGR